MIKKIINTNFSSSLHASERWGCFPTMPTMLNNKSNIHISETETKEIVKNEEIQQNNSPIYNDPYTVDGKDPYE